MSTNVQNTLYHTVYCLHYTIKSMLWINIIYMWKNMFCVLYLQYVLKHIWMCKNIPKTCMLRKNNTSQTNLKKVESIIKIMCVFAWLPVSVCMSVKCMVEKTFDKAKERGGNKQEEEEERKHLAGWGCWWEYTSVRFNLHTNNTIDWSKSMTYFPLPNSILPKFTLRETKGSPGKGRNPWGGSVMLGKML